MELSFLGLMATLRNPDTAPHNLWVSKHNQDMALGLVPTLMPPRKVSHPSPLVWS